MYYKLVCIEVDGIGYYVHVDKNFGELSQVHDYLLKTVKRYPRGVWKLYPIMI